jgi:alpha-amylase
MARKLDGKKVAILVADGFEQVEMTKPRKALVEAGAQTKIVSLKSGKYITLTAKVLPSYATNKTVTWRSSNTTVATVSSKGKVIAHTTGTATITASTANGIRATCTVTVMGVQVTSVGISKRSATMYTNSTLQLTATVSPSSAVDKSLRWSSSNPAIASVTQNGW